MGLGWPWSVLGISPVDPQPAECGRGCFAVGSAEAFGATGPATGNLNMREVRCAGGEAREC